MKKDKFDQYIKDVFEEEVPDVLQKIKASPDFYVPEKPRTFSFSSIFKNRIAMSLASVFVLVIMIVGITRYNATPVAASIITIDVNPSIEIQLDDDDLVLSVTALNNDGEQIVSRNIEYLGMTLDEVIEILIERLGELGYIIESDTENNIVLIDVESENLTIQARVELALKQRLDAELSQFGGNHWVLNAREISLTAEQRQALLEDTNLNRVTRAKMILIYRIHILDESYTVEDLLQYTVRELYNIYIQLENPDNLPFYDQMPGHRPRQEPFGENQSASLI